MSRIKDNCAMTYQIEASATFEDWLEGLRDKRAKARVITRIDRAKAGNFGDHRSVGKGVSEMRVDEGQGYRIYYTIRDRAVIVLLCGGDKSSQQQDIDHAQQMARELT